MVLGTLIASGNSTGLFLGEVGFSYSGYLCNVLAKLLDELGAVDLPGYLDPVFIGAVISLAVVLLVSGRGAVRDEAKMLRRKLHEVPAEGLDLVRTRNTMLAAKLLFAYAYIGPIMVLTLYVRPYHQAIGRLRDG